MQFVTAFNYIHRTFSSENIFTLTNVETFSTSFFHTILSIFLFPTRAFSCHHCGKIYIRWGQKPKSIGLAVVYLDEELIFMHIVYQ